MSDSKLSCYYHPNREPITKCESCGKLICVECKMVYQQRHSTHYYGGGRIHSGYSGSYYTRHELCTPCYYDRRIKAIKSPMKYFLIVFGGIFIAVAVFALIFTLDFISSWGMPDSYPFPTIPTPTYIVIFPIIFIFIGIGIIITGIVLIITSPKRATAMEVKKEKFFASLKVQPETRTHSYSNSSEFRFCPNCGDKNDPGQKYCEKCGQALIPS